jgi:HK97 family phage portal protein
MIPPLGSIQSASGLLVSQATAMTVSSVNRAVTVRSNDVARCEPSIYETAEDGTRTKIDPEDHAVAKLLTRPNRVQTWFEFARDLWVAYLLRGNAYAAILRDGRGNPTELIWINPDAVMILEAADGNWFYNVNRIGLFQVAMLRSHPVAIPAEDMLHIRGMSFNMLVGASTIGLARDAIGLAMGQSQQQSRWVGNGARPSVVLEAPSLLSDEAAMRLKSSWEEFSAGIQNVGRTAVLEQGITAKPLQLTSVDLQFIDQCNLTVQDIARFFGVPTRKLMQQDTSRGSTIIQEDQSYINETVSPDLEMLEQKIAQTFGLTEEGLGIDIDESPLLRADPLTRYNIGRIGILSGMISPNEWRRGERLPPAVGGDEIRAPVNLAALGSDMTGEAPDGAGRPPAGQMPKPGVPTGGSDVAQEGAHEPELTRGATINVAVDARRAATTKRRAVLSRNEDGTVAFDITETEEEAA